MMNRSFMGRTRKKNVSSTTEFRDLLNWSRSKASVEKAALTSREKSSQKQMQFINSDSN